jgi:hypothetical protein
MTSKYFEDLDIDPFEIVDVSRNCDKKSLKKAYLKQALLIHPDKTNGKTRVEFDLLVESYNYIKEILDGKIKDPHSMGFDINATDYRDNFKDQEEINYTRTKMDYNKHRELYVPNGLPSNLSDSQENIDAIFGKRQKASKSYNPSESTGNQINMFGKDTYNSNKFNAMFELHKEKYGCNQAFEENSVVDDPLGFETNSSLSPMDILTYRGLIIEKPQDSLKLKVHDIPKQQHTLKDLQRTKSFKNKLNIVKSKENPISLKEMGKLINQKNKNVVIKNSGSFAEANEQFYQEKVKRMNHEMENNKEIVEKYSTNIYEPAYITDYHKGLIQDSSTGIFSDRDPHFKKNERKTIGNDRQFQNVFDK